LNLRDLRRCCDILMNQQGVPLHIVSKVLGHISTGVTKRVYAHLAPKQLNVGLVVPSGLHRDMYSKPEKTAVYNRITDGGRCRVRTCGPCRVKAGKRNFGGRSGTSSS